MITELNELTFSVPSELGTAVERTLADWTENQKVARLWAGDASLWTGADENKWVGWLGIVDEQRKQIDRLQAFAEEVKQDGFADALLLGMGGSSLCPEVFSLTFGKHKDFPQLHVLDSTDPAQITSIENQIDLNHTLFFVSSKSGSTLEPNIFQQYFFERVRQALGEDLAGSRFVAITDPGSKMQQVAEKQGFRKVLFGLKSIGGRYSALSDFGMAPAAAMGMDVATFLDRTGAMKEACTNPRADENPGVTLGAILGNAHNQGKDKVTIIASPGIHDLGAWLEQLLAESTGKIGKGLIPVDRELLGKPEVYGADRVFAYLRLESAVDADQDAAVTEIERAGHPVVRIAVRDIYQLGREMFRWEIATAVAGSIIGINPFDQPDVEASKIATRKLTEEYETTGSLPSETAFFIDGKSQLFADERNADALKSTALGQSLSGYLKAHLDRLKQGDYFALLGYVQMNEQHEAILQSIREAVRNRKRVATCLGFGPRFLHSTGQAYKGGPNSGVFLQITCDDQHDLKVPEQKYTFGIVKAAQARGDFQVLAARGRRALRVHLGEDVTVGLERLARAMKSALV